MVSSRTAVNAIIGAVAAILLSALPLSTVLGGLIAGFLEGPDGREGALAGGLSGLLSFLPFLGFAALLFAFLGLGVTLGAAPVGGAFFVALVFGVIVALTFVYTVVFALIGGYLGAYLAREYPDHHANARDVIGTGESRRADRYETN